jgi:hypothetical protein
LTREREETACRKKQLATTERPMPMDGNLSVKYEEKIWFRPNVMLFLTISIEEALRLLG